MQVVNHPDYQIFEDGTIIGKKGNPLKPVLTSHGYCKVALDRVQYQHHVLVAKHFVPNPDNYPFVNHKDGNKTNNAAKNLEWVTCAQNNQHARENLLNSERRRLVKIPSLGKIVFGVRRAAKLLGVKYSGHLVESGRLKYLTKKEERNVLKWFQMFELNNLNDLVINYIEA